LLRWATPRTEAPLITGVGPFVSAPEADDITSIEGIDIWNGLRRVAGNKRLYRDLLNQFAMKQHDADQGIKRALEAGDTKTAERIAHTVKGVAAKIGMIAVHHC